MPHTNQLFALLAQYDANPSSSPFEGVEIKKFSKSEKKYALIHLFARRDFEIILNSKRYLIDESHLTIVEKPTQRSHYSNYHYTVTIKNNMGNTFKIRVYFDGQDQVLSTPSIDSQDETAPPILNDADKKVLIDLAKAHALPVITKLHGAQRTQRSKMTDDLNSEMNALYLLPMETVEQLQMCLRQADDILLAAECLKAMGGSYQPLELLKCYKHNVEWMIIDQSQPAMTEPEKRTSLEREPGTNNEAKDKPTVQVEDSEAVDTRFKAGEEPDIEQKKQAQLNECLIRLDRHRADCEPDKKPTPEQMKDFHRTSQEALVTLLDCKSKNIPKEVFQTINNTLSVSLNLCITRLGAAVIRDDEETLAALKDYTPCLPDNYLATAINANNTRRLAWLLSNGRFPLDNMRLMLKQEGKTDQLLSPLGFAAARNKNECFQLLLEAGASPMVKESDGLPLAHHILMNRSGYFAPLLTLFYAKKYTYLPFIEELITTLRAHCASLLCTEEQRLEIEKTIAFYTVLKESVNREDLNAFYTFCKEREEFRKEHLSVTGMQGLDDIFNDPEIRELLKNDFKTADIFSRKTDARKDGGTRIAITEKLTKREVKEERELNDELASIASTVISIDQRLNDHIRSARFFRGNKNALAQSENELRILHMDRKVLLDRVDKIKARQNKAETKAPSFSR